MGLNAGRVRREAVLFGLGHIGASLAGALAGRGWKSWGWDRNAAAVRYCRERGWLAGALGAKPEFESHNLLCLIALPEAAVDDPKLAAMLARLPAGTIVTDLFSSKGEASAALRRTCGDLGLRYGWSHPLAGREGSGAASADPLIFERARVLVDAGAPADVRAELARFWKGLGCVVEHVTTAEHQKRMACGSHLMHVLAFSLMHAIGDTPAATPSVLGATRVAKSNPEAWASILISNRESVAASVDRLQSQLKKVTRLLRSTRGRALLQYLLEAQRRRLRLEEEAR